MSVTVQPEKHPKAPRLWLCWFRHKWSKWSKPNRSWEHSIFYQQQRECLRCGNTQIVEKTA